MQMIFIALIFGILMYILPTAVSNVILAILLVFAFFGFCASAFNILDKNIKSK